MSRVSQRRAPQRVLAVLAAGCSAGLVGLVGLVGCRPDPPSGPVSTVIDWPADEPVIGFVPSDWTDNAALVVGPHRWQIVPSPQQSTSAPRQPRTTDTARNPTAAVTLGPGYRVFLVAANGVPTAIEGDQLRSPGGIRLLTAVVHQDADGHGRKRVVNPAGVAVLDSDDVLVATQTSPVGTTVPRDAIVYAVGGYLGHPIAGRVGNPATKPLSTLEPGELADGSDYGVGRVRALAALDVVDALLVSDSTLRAGGRPTPDDSLLERSGTILRGQGRRGQDAALCSGPLAPAAVRVSDDAALITVSARTSDGSCSPTQTAYYRAEVDRSRVTRPYLELSQVGTGTGYGYGGDGGGVVTLARPSAGRLTITWPS